MAENLVIDLSFDAEYRIVECFLGGDLAGSRRFTTDDSGSDEVLSVVFETRAGARWPAAFSCGNTVTYFSGVSTCPDPGHALVVAKGQCYYVNVNSGTIESAPTYFATGTAALVERGMLVVYDLVKIIAINQSGSVWVTRTRADTIYAVYDRARYLAAVVDIAELGHNVIIMLDPSTGVIIEEPLDLGSAVSNPGSPIQP